MPARAATASSVKLRPPDSRITASAASKILSRSISFFRVKINPLLFRLVSRISFPTRQSDNMAIGAVQDCLRAQGGAIMLACLSPNGMNRYDGASAPDRLLVATSSGVTTLARASSGAWRKAGTALAALHATTLTTLPGQPGGFVGTHGNGVLFSEDGARWEERNSGLAFKNVYTVASVAEAGGIALYAGTQPAALFKRRALGQS